MTHLNELLLPGTIPGLLRRGSPVVCQTRPYHGWRGVYFDAPHCVAVVAPGATQHLFIDVVFSELQLDLTDATGRAHAAWALAAQSKWWPDEPDYSTAAWRRLSDGLGIGFGARHGWPWSNDALTDLDPNDPRLLPDGSRWVDAEALRRVVLHVAGGAT